MRSLVLVCSLVLVFGCGDDSDPSQMDVAGVAGSGGAAGDGGGEAGSDNLGGGAEQGGAAGEGGQATNDGQNPDPFGVCPDDVSFVGQVKGAGAGLPDGGTAVFEPWDASYQSGLAQVIENMPNEDIRDDESTADVNESWLGLTLENPISVVGATVIATSFDDRANNLFWVADASGAIEVRLNYEDPTALPAVAIHVGQKLSFTVTNVNTFYGTPRIKAISDVTVTKDEDGMDITNASVYIWTPDRTLTVEDTHQLVRITGTLAGTGRDCDTPNRDNPNRCWDIDYGFGRAVFRSRSNFIESGQCITFVGPLGSFDGQPQLNSENFDWVKDY